MEAALCRIMNHRERVAFSTTGTEALLSNAILKTGMVRGITTTNNNQMVVATPAEGHLVVVTQAAGPTAIRTREIIMQEGGHSVTQAGAIQAVGRSVTQVTVTHHQVVAEAVV